MSKKALIVWDKICAPKATEGLNLINMDMWNKAAIAKNYWDFAHKEITSCELISNLVEFGF